MFASLVYADVESQGQRVQGLSQDTRLVSSSAVRVDQLVCALTTGGSPQWAATVEFNENMWIPRPVIDRTNFYLQPVFQQIQLLIHC